MRVVVTGASGNVGTSVLRSLGHDPAVDSILGLARRIPEARFSKTEWAAADVAYSDLTEHFRGADAVVHLAWLIQPGRDESTTQPGQRGRQPAGVRRRGRGRGQVAGVRLVGRGVLEGPQGPGGGRVVGDRGNPLVVLLAAQVRGRADPRPLRVGQPRRPGRAPAAGSDLQARRRHGNPAAVRRAVPAQPAGATGVDPGGARRGGAALPGRPLPRRGRGVSAGGDQTMSRARSTSPRTRCSTPSACLACSAHGGYPSRGRCCEPRRP